MTTNKQLEEELKDFNTKGLLKPKLYSFTEVKELLISLEAKTKADLKEKIESMNCDLCGKENKIWDQRREETIKCDGFKHSVLELLNKSI